MNELQSKQIESLKSTTDCKLAIYGLYSVYDKKSEVYSPVQMFRNNAEAIRFFADFISDKTSLIAKHPCDFCVYRVGFFDIKTGDIDKTLNNHSEYIIECEDLVNG